MEKPKPEHIYVAKNVAKLMGEILARECVKPFDIDEEYPQEPELEVE